MKDNVIVPTFGKNYSEDPEKIIQGVVHPKRLIYKLVLTGGPCGGKTTGQARLASSFESLGWKVYRVPETATVLMSGGISFGELNDEQVFDFQENLIRTMISLEDTYFSMAEKCTQNCLIICDRGVMDASAFVTQEKWKKLLNKLNLDEMEVSENRYNHIVHMVSAACGAEDFYTVEDHAHRFEGIELARERDQKAMEAWAEHPYVDIVDNTSKDFENKIKHLIDVVVKRLGLESGENFKADSRKVKFHVTGPLPDDSLFPKFTDFDVVHHYLQTAIRGIQSRLRKRGRDGRWSYTCSVRRPETKGQIVEVKTPINKRDYENLLNYRDERHFTIVKTRRCFLYNNHQFQLDIYKEPCHPRCKGMILLQTFTTQNPDDLQLPPFLMSRIRDVTDDPAFSMYNLALKSDWTVNDFCHRLSSSEEDEDDDSAIEVNTYINEARNRLDAATHD